MVIGMLAEKSLGCGKANLPNPLHFKSRTTLNQVQQSQRGAGAGSRAGQSNGFIKDIIRQYKPGFCMEQFMHTRLCRDVQWVVLVGQGI